MGEERADDRDLSLSPKSIAKVSARIISPSPFSYALFRHIYTLPIRIVLLGPGNLTVSLFKWMCLLGLGLTLPS